MRDGRGLMRKGRLKIGRFKDEDGLIRPRYIQGRMTPPR